MLRRQAALAIAICAVVAASEPSAAAPSAAYTQSVLTVVRKQVAYPPIAKMREQQGVVICRVTISPTGAVTEASVKTSSGNVALDNAAIEAVLSAAPLPPPPSGPATVELPIVFSLK